MTELEHIEAVYDDETSVEIRLQIAGSGVNEYPISADLWFALGNLILLSHDDGQYELADAKHAYETALTIDPTHADALEGLGAFLDEVEDDAAAAESYLRKAIESGAEEQAYAVLGRVLAERERKPEALGLLDHASCPFADTKVVIETRQEIIKGIWDPENVAGVLSP